MAVTNRLLARAAQKRIDVQAPLSELRKPSIDTAPAPALDAASTIILPGAVKPGEERYELWRLTLK